MKIFDTHCDTAYVIHRLGVAFDNDQTHITKNETKDFEMYEQMFALWSSNKRTGEENWEHFHKTKAYYETEILPYKSDRFIPHLAIEGGALLDNDISRVDKLKEYGVRMMTLVWKDDCCIGGAHNTNNGLTEFGKSVVNKMFEIGIVPDVSHASDKMICETLEIAKKYNKPIYASHSNSRTVKNHTRNLTDEFYKEIAVSGGIAGISFCCEHLDYIDEKEADLTSIIRHIEHYLSIGGEEHVCLGCDFDGIKKLPKGITGASSLAALKEELVKINYNENLIDKIFYTNAHNFFQKN